MSETAIVSTTPMQLLDNAIAKGVDTEQLSKLMDLQERWETGEARRAFSTSMVDVHSEIPIIAKELYNKHTDSKYADLGAVIAQTKSIYTKHGFSIVFHEGKAEGEDLIRICADVIHRSGHKEVYYYDAPMEGKGIKGNSNMTPTHGKASSTSYARRYLMYMIFNIPTGDDDGNVETLEPVSESQLAELLALAQEIGKKADDPKMLKYFHVESLEQLPAKYFKDAISAMESWR